MFIKIILVVSPLLTMYVDSTFVDQSQSGGLNVQVDLKDLQIIALMKGGKEEYVDYDYAYDYSEMTIKPQNRTTPRPVNDTSSTNVETNLVVDNVTIPAAVFLETTTALTQASETVETTLDQTVNHNSSTIKNTISYNNVTELPGTARSTTVATTSISTPSGTATTTICKKGFTLNSRGDCEIKLQGTGNALLKLVKLSQKLKLRRQNKSGNDDLE